MIQGVRLCIHLSLFDDASTSMMYDSFAGSPPASLILAYALYRFVCADDESGDWSCGGDTVASDAFR